MSSAKPIAVVYEISGNPLFTANAAPCNDRLTEFACPSEINHILEVLHAAHMLTEVVDGPLDLLSRASDIKRTCHCIFNKSLGFSGLERKIHVPAICQLFDIPLIGSSAYAMTLARHKFHTNRLLRGLGLPVPDARLWTTCDRPGTADLRFPLIVKPNEESDAIGIDETSVVYDPAEAASRADWVTSTFMQPAIIEEYVAGEEWKVAVLGNGKSARAIGVVGLMRDGAPIVNSLQSRVDVIEDRLDFYVPADSGALNDAMTLAVYIHRTLGLRDYSRADFRLDQRNRAICMEVSTHPELTPHSSYVQAALQTFESFSDVVVSIVTTAQERFLVTG